MPSTGASGTPLTNLLKHTKESSNVFASSSANTTTELLKYCLRLLDILLDLVHQTTRLLMLNAKCGKLLRGLLDAVTVVSACSLGLLECRKSECDGTMAFLGTLFKASQMGLNNLLRVLDRNQTKTGPGLRLLLHGRSNGGDQRLRSATFIHERRKNIYCFPAGLPLGRQSGLQWRPYFSNSPWKLIERSLGGNLRTLLSLQFMLHLLPLFLRAR